MNCVDLLKIEGVWVSVAQVYGPTEDCSVVI